MLVGYRFKPRPNGHLKESQIKGVKKGRHQHYTDIGSNLGLMAILKRVNKGSKER